MWFNFRVNILEKKVYLAISTLTKFRLKDFAYIGKLDLTPTKSVGGGSVDIHEYTFYHKCVSWMEHNMIGE
jgi:hypothetical protein